MKVFLFWLSGLAWLPCLASAQGPAELRGRLTNAAATDTLVVSWWDQPLSSQERQVAVRPDERGNFRLVVPIVRPTMAQLNYGSQETTLFLEPGDALMLKGSSEDPSSLRFDSGDGTAHKPAAAANNYLQEFETRFAANDGYQVLPDNIALFEAGFLSFLDYRRRQEQDFLRQAARHDAFTPAFAAAAQADIDYTYADDRLTFADLREQTLPGQPRLTLSAGYYDFLKTPGVVTGNEAAATSSRYQDFLLNYVHYLVRTAGHQSTEPAYFPTCYRLADSLLTGAARPVVLGRVVLEAIRFGHVAHAQAMLENYAATAKAPPGWVAQLRASFASHQTYAIGSPAPDIPLRQADGKPVSLATYQGKLVYLLFWDSRNPSGQRELPYLKPLTTALAGQPIEIILVALDDQSTHWQQQIVGTIPPLSGIQTYVPSSYQQMVRRAYGIERTPTAVLIAEDGTLLDLHPHLVSSRPLQDDLKIAIGRAAAYRAVSLARL